MAKLNEIQKYVRGLIMSGIMQHFIMLFGAGVLYEIYLVLMGLSASTRNNLLGWELDWMLPFHILLSGTFLIFYFFPLDILNLVLLLSFIRIDRKRNQANSWWKSIGIFFLLLLGAAPF